MGIWNGFVARNSHVFTGVATVADLFAAKKAGKCAVIMGLQNALSSAMSHGKMRTTHMTGHVTDLGLELWEQSADGVNEAVDTLVTKRLRPPVTREAMLAMARVSPQSASTGMSYRLLDDGGFPARASLPLADAPGLVVARTIAMLINEGADAVLQGVCDETGADAAMKRMNGEFFEIDPRIAICEARLAPDGSASAPYYNPPSEDLSRPGTTWIPMLGKNEVSNWHLVSTWYHEAVPGHHLQIGTATVEKDRLTRFQRTSAWISGYGEGWALYAERFMNELGAFDEPGIEMGYLSAQALRAARIVVDIGMHLGYKDDNGVVWNAESSRKLLNEQALLDQDHSRSETDRYLGWPGQAISYKVGERVWMNAREDAKERLGDGFNMKKFHSYALKLGPMGLDPFAAEMALWKGQ